MRSRPPPADSSHSSSFTPSRLISESTGLPGNARVTGEYLTALPFEVWECWGVTYTFAAPSCGTKQMAVSGIAIVASYLCGAFGHPNELAICVDLTKTNGQGTF
jgi:hypothetical protein